MKRQLTFVLLATSLASLSAFAEGEIDLKCVALDPAKSLGGIHGAQIVIYDPIQEYAHVETLDAAGNASFYAVFNPRSDDDRSFEVSRRGSEDEVLEVIRVERSAKGDRLVLTRSESERDTFVETIALQCAR